MPFACSGCPNKSEKGKAPSKWKRFGEKLFCGKCKVAQFSPRALTIPMVCPVSVVEEEGLTSLKNGDWSVFRAALGTCWQQTTQLSNWCVTRLSQLDVVRSPGMDKLPKMSAALHNQLYSEAVSLFPDIYRGSLQSVVRSVWEKYQGSRLDTRWKFSAVTPTFRFPQPFPVRAANWSASLNDYGGGRIPIVSVPLLAGSSGGRFLVRLKGGHEYRRQLEEFARIAEGEAERGTLSLSQRGEKVMLTMVAWFPKRVGPKVPEKAMVVRTDPNALLVVEVDGARPWVWNGDDIRRVVQGHQAFLRRISQDTKFERRVLQWRRKNMNLAREPRCDKYANRTTTFCHQVSASLAAYAARNAVAKVVYDDSVKSYIEGFCWFKLKTMISQKVGERNIDFIAS